MTHRKPIIFSFLIIDFSKVNLYFNCHLKSKVQLCAGFFSRVIVFEVYLRDFIKGRIGCYKCFCEVCQ